MEEIEKIKNLIELENFNLALKELKKNKDKIEKAEYHFYFAEILRIQGLLHLAINQYKKSLKFNPSKILKIEILNKLSSCFRAIGNKKEALKFCELALKICLKNKISQENTLLEKAMILRLSGEYDKAIKIFNKLIKIYSIKKDLAGISYIYWASGGIYRLKGKFKESIEYFQKSFEIAKKIQDKDLKAYALFGLAGVLRVAGNIEKSFLTYKKAQKLISKNDIFGKAYSFCGMANSLRQQGKLEAAFKLYMRSNQLYKLTGDKPDLGFTYWGMGEILKKKGDFKKALKYFITAEKLFKSGYEKRGEILNLISMAQTIYLMGKIKKAQKLFDKAYKLSKKEKLNTYLEIFT